MPWCPKCGYEYKEGYTVCADCNVELVDELEDKLEDKIHVMEDESPAPVSPEDEEDIVAMMMNEGDVSEAGAEAVAAMLEKAKHASAEPFVKASVRAENYKSSAYALFIVGIIGLVFLILTYFKLIPINLAPNINLLFYIVMGIMFVIFIVIGVKSLSMSKVIAASSKDEEDLTDRINTYFENGFTGDSLDKIAFSVEEKPLSEEEMFFPRSQAIRNEIVKNFGSLDESYLTEMTENIYSKLYE